MDIPIIAVNDVAPVAWRYKTSSSDIEDYNADRKLLSTTANNGLKQELFYDTTNGLLTRVKDTASFDINDRLLNQSTQTLRN